MDRLILAAALAAVAVAVAAALRRRRPAPPTQARWAVPQQLDRSDFAAPDAPWLVAVFTSATCDSCPKATAKAAPLASAQVGYQEVSYQERRDLHDRYAVEAVPTTVLADAEGVVRASFVGVPDTAELWATVAKTRDAGRAAPSAGPAEPA